MIKKLRLLLPLFIIALVLSMFRLPAAHANFNSNDIIDDTVFNNSGTMTAAQIDSFLNSYSSSCISTNNGFTTPEPIGYTPSNGYAYGGNVSAGTAIYDVSKVYSINPQVFLTTLQKEQSLVTGEAGCHSNTPDSSNTFQCNLWGSGNIACTSACPYSGGCIPIAMGNNCPGNCQASTEGFSKQLVTAAWKLKYWEQRSEGNVNWDVQVSNFPHAGDAWDNSDDVTQGSDSYCYSGLRMTQGYFQLCPNGSFATYDGYSSVYDDNNNLTSVHLDSGATAALYNYTPYFSGNEKFVSLFETTFSFGSTTGQLVKTAAGSTVYLLSGDDAHPIRDLQTLSDFSPLGPVRVTTASEINTYHGASAMIPLVKGSGSTIYFVNAGIRLTFNSCNMVADYGYSCAQAISLDDSQINQLHHGPPVTSFIRGKTGNSIYYMDGGDKRPLPSWNDLTEFSSSPGMNTLTDSAVGRFPTGTLAWGPTTLLKTANSSTVYIVKDIHTLYVVPSLTYIRELGVGTNIHLLGASHYTVSSSIENKLVCS